MITANNQSYPRLKYYERENLHRVYYYIIKYIPIPTVYIHRHPYNDIEGTAIVIRAHIIIL